MNESVLDLKKQMPDILRALKRREKVIVSYGGKKLALMQPLSEGEKETMDIRSNPAFGMWSERDDLVDPASVVREMRKGRGHAL